MTCVHVIAMHADRKAAGDAGGGEGGGCEVEADRWERVGVRGREMNEKRKGEKIKREIVISKGFPVWRIRNDCSLKNLYNERGRGGVVGAEEIKQGDKMRISRAGFHQRWLIALLESLILSEGKAGESRRLTYLLTYRSKQAAHTLSL